MVVETKTQHLLPASETSSTRNGSYLHLIKLLAEGAHGNPQTTQVIAERSPQTDGKAPIAEDNSCSHISQNTD